MPSTHPFTCKPNHIFKKSLTPEQFSQMVAAMLELSEIRTDYWATVRRVKVIYLNYTFNKHSLSKKEE